MLGCGGSAKPVAKQPDPVKDPIPKTAGPPCDKVGVHLAQIAGAGKVDTDGRVAKHFTKVCSTDAWSDEVRSCFAAIENDAESEGCVGKLTDAQRESLSKPLSVGGAPTESAVAAPPPPGAAPKAEAPRTRAPVRKKPTGGGDDPCQGGE